jgi:hypothetical protein
MQPPSVDPAAQQLTQLLAQPAGADQVHPPVGASEQEHRIAVVDLTELGDPPDVGVVAELVGPPRRQHPPERLARVLAVGPAGLAGQPAKDHGPIDVDPEPGLSHISHRLPLTSLCTASTVAHAGHLAQWTRRLWTTPVDNTTGCPHLRLGTERYRHIQADAPDPDAAHTDHPPAMGLQCRPGPHTR